MLMQQNEAVASRRDLFVQMVAATDRVTPMTGLAPSVQIVKAGETQYGSFFGSASEIAEGTYRIRLAPNDLNTLGAAVLKVAGSGAATQFIEIQVVRFLDEVHLAKAALANTRTHVVNTGVNQIKDDDGSTILRTLTPNETNGVITVAAS